jgi:spore germination cell wall hydrolase CwlJ-like protein
VKLKIIITIAFIALPHYLHATPSTNSTYNPQAKHKTSSGTNIDDLVSEINQRHRDKLIESIRKLQLSKERDVICLALSVYHEARSSSRNDQLAVAFVGLNRLKANGEFGNTMCEVINQRLLDSLIPQYSWLMAQSATLIPKDYNAWINAQQIAYSLAMFSHVDPSHGARYFWNISILKLKPWMKTGKAYFRIGNHIFMTVSNQ